MSYPSSIHVLAGLVLITMSPCFSAAANEAKQDSKDLQAVRQLAGTSVRPYAVVVDANTLEHPEWGQVVEALKKKYNAKVFVAHYPELGTVRKALNEYMPWYVCFVAQPEQATREMITAAAHTMTWLDDDPYEDAIWAVLTGLVPEDALRIVNAEPLVVRKTLSNLWDGWLDWLEGGVSLASDYKFIKDSDGVTQQLENRKKRLPEFVELLNRDECDIISTGGHAGEHALFFGYPDTATDGYITHNAKGDIYGVDTQGKVHPVNAKKLKIFFAAVNCNIGHIDGKSCMNLAWIHHGVNAFFGRLYAEYGRTYHYPIAEYFMALQGRYTFAESIYANWLMSRFSEDKLLEIHPCLDRVDKSNVLYGDPAWDARVKHTTDPAYTQDLNIVHLPDGLIGITVSITISQKWEAWGWDGWAPAVRPTVLLPFRIQDATVQHTDLDKMDVADNFIVLDLGTPIIGGPDLPIGTKKSVVLHAKALEAWSFLSDDEVVARMREQRLDNVSRCIDFLTDETVDPNERTWWAAEWSLPSILAKEADVNSMDEDGRTPLHLAVESAKKIIVEVLLGKGADINAKDNDGQTPLHLAAESADKDIIEFLLNKDADINAKDKQGHTPLYIAAKSDCEIAEFLLSKGADGSIRTESGQTLLELIQQRKQIGSIVPDLTLDGALNSWFGSKIACGDVDGDGFDDVLIGAAKYDNRRGRVYLFYGGPDMDKNPDLIFEGQNEGDFFGSGLSCGDIDNDGLEDILIGAGLYNNQQGRAYLYWGSDRKSMDAHPDTIFTGEAGIGSGFGMGWPTVYDIDNDGYDDILLGAYRTHDSKGQVNLYYGNRKELMNTSPDWILSGETPGDQFGYAISCGDVDNDGYGDIFINSAKQQRVHLFYGGSRTNMDGNADVTFAVESGGNDSWSYGMAFIDQDRDGYDDVVFGVPGHNKQGRSYLFHGGSRRSIDTDPDMVFDGEIEQSKFGIQNISCDIDGDTLDDLVIGASGDRQSAGSVYVYWGKDLAIPNPRPGRILTGEHPNDKFGFGLACGDVNNDSFDDLVVGAYTYRAGTDQGRAYLYYGGPRSK